MHTKQAPEFDLESQIHYSSCLFLLLSTNGQHGQICLISIRNKHNSRHILWQYSLDIQEGLPYTHFQ